MTEERNALLHFLADETHNALARAQNAEAPASVVLLNEAEELMAIRLRILRRHEDTAQLELPLDMKVAA